MDFNWVDFEGARRPPETLLLDAIAGDATLYTRQDMVEASWSVVQPILDYWGTRKFALPNYTPGTWGPVESDQKLARRRHQMRRP